MSSNASAAIDFFDDLIRRWNEAWNAHDLDTIEKMLAEDVYYEDPAIIPAGKVRGRQEVVEWARSMMRSSPNLHFEGTGIFVSTDGSRGIWEWRGSGTFENAIEPPGIPPTGKSFEICGADMIETAGDRIRHVRSTWNFKDFAEQLGMH